MFRHNLVLFYRNISRHKSSFFINIIGLSTGLACALLIYLWVYDELQVDKFHEKNDRLFQVMQNEQQPNGITTFEFTPGQLAKSLAEEMPEVESASGIIHAWHNSQGILSAGDKRIKAKEMYADREFFNIFSYKLISGDKNRLLDDKHNVVISDELALQLFGTTENIAGKRIDWVQGKFDGPYIIAGVFEKPPHNSTAQFDLAFSYDLFMEKNPTWLKWGNSSSKTYVVLRKDAKIHQFNQKIAGFLQTKDAESKNTLFVRKYSDQHLYGNYENGVQAGGRIAYVKLFSLIAIFILIIACINFMNLSTAKASIRLKEIGIKKVVGARRVILMVQYLSESVLMAFLSLLVAILLIVILLPSFNEITGKQLTLNIDSSAVFSIFIITLFTGLIAGSYPALYLSGFSPLTVLKGKLRIAVGEVWVRKGLVVFQFTTSVILIVSVLVVYQQMKFIQTKNLGYNKDNIIYFDAEVKNESFSNELKNIPGVLNIARFYHNLTGDHGTAGGFSWQGQQPGGKQIQFANLEVGYDFVETFGMQMLAGRSFSRELGSADQIILNEAAIESMGLKDPVGKIFKIWGKERKIVGVVKNFHYSSLYEKISPSFLLLVPFSPGAHKIMVKIKAGSEKATIDKLRQFYQANNPGLPFDYKFLDEDYQALYASEQRVAVLSRYFAGLAILISCLGLFGLAAFTAQKRTKEIGIRKVLGASVQNLSFLLTREFITLVLLANCIAWPIAWYGMHQWLADFSYKIEISVWIFIAATIVALLIAILTVGLQAIKAAMANPAKSLRTE